MSKRTIRLHAVTLVDVSEGNDLLGYAHVLPWRDGYFVCRLQVKIEHRRKGVGNSIMRTIIARYGDKPVYLEPSPFNGDPMNVDQLTQWYERLGFESIDLAGHAEPIMRFAIPERMDRVRLRNLLSRAMANPENLALDIVYRSKDHQLTRRTISPIRFERTGAVLATCCGRGEPRQFCFEQIITAAERSAADVLMPEGVR